MAKFRAVLIEDEPSSAHATEEVLEATGFSVSTYGDAVSALAHVDESTDRPIDLLVLDRRLPRRYGEAPSDQVGDELLTAMLEKYIDAVAVVFSGHTGFHHQQFATADRGVVSMARGRHIFDRVRLFEKGQSLEFDAHLTKLHKALSELDDIQVISENAELSARDKRLLRRVAMELEGASIEARPLVGGLTSSPVWLCSVHTEMHPTARIVVKRQKRRREAGGFETLCPAQLSAGTISVVHGFCGGHFVAVQQLVGEDPVPLMTLIVTDPAKAGSTAVELAEKLDNVPSGQMVNLQIAEIALSLIDWETVRERGSEFGIDVPPGSRIASTIRSAQHGDLHPGNVLVSGDQAVLIDFDSQTVGSELIDPVALLLGPLFHPDSPLRSSEWPAAEQCLDFMSDEFLVGSPAPVYFTAVFEWLRRRQRSGRELQAIVLAYAVRQLGFPDVLRDDTVKKRAIAVAMWAAKKLEDD